MKQQILLGTYTDGKSEGLYEITLDTDEKCLEGLKNVIKTDNPSYTDFSEDNTLLVTIANNGNQGGIASYERVGEGYYTLLDQSLEEGSAPAYVSYDEKRSLVYSANYKKGHISVHHLDSEGKLTLVDRVEHSGSSEHENQEAPHPHYIARTPNDKFVVVCDLGTDKIYTYKTEDDNTLTEVHQTELAAGTGPRHLVFHPSGKFAYVLGELSSEVLLFEYDEETGVFNQFQMITSLPVDFDEWNSGAAIRMSSDGRHLYSSNRGHNSIVVYEIHQKAGGLRTVGWVPTEGNTPRDFNLDPTDTFVVCGHQDTDALTLFERDSETGLLTLIEKDIYAPAVVNVNFL